MMTLSAGLVGAGVTSGAGVGVGALSFMGSARTGTVFRALRLVRLRIVKSQALLSSQMVPLAGLMRLGVDSSGSMSPEHPARADTDGGCRGGALCICEPQN